MILSFRLERLFPLIKRISNACTVVFTSKVSLAILTIRVGNVKATLDQLNDNIPLLQ